MQGSAAELDFMLQDAGIAVVIARGATTIASTNGLLDSKELFTMSGEAVTPAGVDRTLAIRDGTQLTARLEDVVMAGGVSYRLRSLGVAQADGLRHLTIAGG